MIIDKKGIIVLKHNEVCIHMISYTKGTVAHFHHVTDEKKNEIKFDKKYCSTTLELLLNQFVSGNSNLSGTTS